ADGGAAGFGVLRLEALDSDRGAQGPVYCPDSGVRGLTGRGHTPGPAGDGPVDSLVVDVGGAGQLHLDLHHATGETGLLVLAGHHGQRRRRGASNAPTTAAATAGAPDSADYHEGDGYRPANELSRTHGEAPYSRVCHRYAGTAQDSHPGPRIGRHK